MKRNTAVRVILPCPGLELATAFIAAEQGVSGDFHLVARGPAASTIMVVGDAMGHGLQAARRATFVRTSLATFAPAGHAVPLDLDSGAPLGEDRVARATGPERTTPHPVGAGELTRG